MNTKTAVHQICHSLLARDATIVIRITIVSFGVSFVSIRGNDYKALLLASSYCVIEELRFDSKPMQTQMTMYRTNKYYLYCQSLPTVQYSMLTIVVNVIYYYSLHTIADFQPGGHFIGRPPMI